MKKISVLVMLAMMVVVFSPQVFAKNESAGTGTGSGAGTPMVTKAVGVVNQNQVKTQNAGEGSQLMVNTEEKESTGEVVTTPMRSEMAQEKMSEVAKGVEDILMAKTMKGGIGDQVRVIAQEQKESQEQVKSQIKKVEGRGNLAKAFFGPDYKALKGLETQYAQNELRIEQLMELKNQLVNTGDAAMVQETIDALVQQNVSLQEMIVAENKVGSAFGWLLKLFVK